MFPDLEEALKLTQLGSKDYFWFCQTGSEFPSTDAREA